MLEIFTNAVNELAFCVGYSAIFIAIIFTVGTVIKNKMSKKVEN